MMKEILGRFPEERVVRQEVSLQGSHVAAAAFARLREGLAEGEVVVACWTKPPFGNERSFPIRDARTLSFVVGGVLAGWCENLRFFAQEQGRVVRPNGTYQDLFLH